MSRVSHVYLTMESCFLIFYGEFCQNSTLGNIPGAMMLRSILLYVPSLI